MLCGAPQSLEWVSLFLGASEGATLWLPCTPLYFPGYSDSKSICLQCRRPGFNPCVGKILWRKKWQLTPVFLPGKSHGWRSLVGYNPWGGKELDTTERLHFHFHFSLSCIGEGNGNPLVFLPGESQGQQSLVDCRLWVRTELDTTEVT